MCGECDNGDYESVASVNTRAFVNNRGAFGLETTSFLQRCEIIIPIGTILQILF